MNTLELYDEDYDRQKFEKNLDKAHNIEKRIELCRKYLEYHGWHVNNQVPLLNVNHSVSHNGMFRFYAKVELSDYSTAGLSPEDVSRRVDYNLCQDLAKQIMKSDCVEKTKVDDPLRNMTTYGVKVNVLAPK